MAKHLQIISSGIYAAKAVTVGADSILVGDSAAANETKLTPLSGLVGIPAANMSVSAITNMTATDVQAALAELQADVDTLNSITGTNVGSAATVAGFPTTDREGNAVANGDFAFLTADDGGNQKGIWVYDGASWNLGLEIPDLTALIGATAGVAGTAGIAPGAAAGQQNFVLTGGAVYADPNTLISNPVMVGATAGTAGVIGLVPAAAAGDENNYLRADGTWQAVSIAAETLQQTLTAGNVSTLDLEFTSATAGMILLSANATRYRITVDNDGSLITTAA